MTQPKIGLSSQVLFNPFLKLAGAPALMLGLVAIFDWLSLALR